jgi:hypothetical protein
MYHRAIKILLISVLFFVMPQIAKAGFLDEISYCVGRGNCNFEDAAIGLNSLIRFLLGSMGAVALIYFVWGGVQWLTSGGNAERVNRGKQIMINTVFSIILAFGSYLIVNFFINDVLNADQFRVEQGSFASCENANAGDACGDGKQCTGSIDDASPAANFSDKCLYTCQVQGLLLSNYAMIGECRSVGSSGEIPGDWTVVSGANTSWCPALDQACVFAPL